MAHDVFISHSHKDKAIADAVCAMLESNGIRCWIAPRDIEPGVDWPTAISTALAGSRVFVLIFSGNANRSEDVGRELILAANNNLVIVPFKIENVTPEPGKLYYLARTHWLDAMNPPTQEQIENLVTAVLAFLPKRRRTKLVTTLKETTRARVRDEAQSTETVPGSVTEGLKPERISLDDVEAEEHLPDSVLAKPKSDKVVHGDAEQKEHISGSAAKLPKPVEVISDDADKKKNFLQITGINPKKMWIGASAVVFFAALVVAAILWFGNKENPYTQQSSAVGFPTTTTDSISANTPDTTNTITASPAPTNTVKPTSTKTRQPTPTQPPWVSEFAEPILSLVEEHTPNLTDDFSSGQASWLTGLHEVSNIGEYVNEQLILKAGNFVFTTFFYSNLVMEFDWRCSRCDWDWSTKGGETKIKFYNQHVKDISSNAPERDYYFTPSTSMNHTMIIVKDSSVAIFINDQPVYYGNYLTAMWEPGQVVFLPGSDVTLDNFKVWNLDGLKD